MFSFPLKLEMAAISGKNCSTSYSFQHIFNVLFSAKIQDGHKVSKMEFFSLCRGYFCTILWVKNLLEIVLSLTVSKIFSMFYFLLKSKMATKCRELKIFPCAWDTLVLSCGSKIRSKLLYLLPFLRYFQHFIFH